MGSEEEFVMQWFLMRQRLVAQLVCLVVQYFMVQKCNNKKRITYNMNSARERVREEVMYRITCSYRGRDIIRMGPEAFLGLCSMLETHGGLKPTRFSSVEEQVAKALYILTHKTKNRVVMFWFRRSGETVSRHFHNVLHAILQLEDKFLVQPDGSRVPTEINVSDKFYPYFKDCVGAIDGTHIRAKVRMVDAPRYRGRKDFPTQNILAACTFDLKFTYMLVGWEGTASNSRIIKDALRREDCLKIPQGKYYLVDAGFMLTSGLITPYRGVRYHLKEYSDRNPPQNYKEIFNLRHSSLRNAIERAFGVLKKRFVILSSAAEPNYGIKPQKLIITACCILHNYLMNVDPDAELIHQVDNELEAEAHFNDENYAPRSDRSETARGELIRDAIAQQMWIYYENNAGNNVL